ncbi:hypothetical protein JTE90_027700 [Oedothorax gibbosus]|uniref:RNA-directed DNA polymerase n=1 Tax=Oedothorax gibbosus TaxID=931172 RepID=A0AAV6UUC1_9ARAC|nr:hypothetical protein JTE90_027700 [Oedothorax gibbosus]
MEEQGIIVRIEEPTEWVSNMVVVDSPKKLRICIDPRPLNEAIRRPHYPISASERLFTNLQGCTVFSFLDAKNGFWQLPLEDASSYLTTFTTPWGRYRFLVLPFGLNNAPEEFQRAMEEIFEAEPQIQPYFDDIALSSKNLQEHCDLLRKALTIARKENLKFNPSKMQIAKSSITYLGHIISEEEIKPDPVKVQGKQLIVADTLSRATCPYVFDEESQSPPSVHASVLAIATSPRWKQLTEMTLQDRVLQVVSRYVTTGWPSERSKVDPVAKPFWHCRDELYLSEERVLCRGNRLVIPEEAKKETLEQLHTAHRGIVACKTKAREYVYWPSMNQDIEAYVERCSICQKHQRSNTQEPLVERDLPQRPWQVVAGDFLTLKGTTYLLLIDYFSKYIEVQHMHGGSASCPDLRS